MGALIVTLIRVFTGTTKDLQTQPSGSIKTMDDHERIDELRGHEVRIVRIEQTQIKRGVIKRTQGVKMIHQTDKELHT